MKTLRFFQGLVLLGLLALAGCGATSGPTTARPAPTATPQAQPADLTYLGSDGNVWEQAFPQGQARRLTADAQAGSISYRGLAWSPDGTLLAVLRTTGTTAPQDALLLLAPDGAVKAQAPLPGAPDNRPFAWSPDGTLIAYRTLTNTYAEEDVNGESLHIREGNLLLLDGRTGQIVKSLTYHRGPWDCQNSVNSPLELAVLTAHQAPMGLDTFAWAPDQRTMLLAYGCQNGASAQVDLTTGATTPGFPEDASYQPGGHLILGLLDGGKTLGLVDVTGNRVGALAQVPPNDFSYLIGLGQAIWSQDGQTVYFEHHDGIWRNGVDGSGLDTLVSGTTLDSQGQATIALLPQLSPDSRRLLYLQLQGSDEVNSAAPVASRWYVAQSDGTHPVPLAQSITEALWRPGG